MGARPIPPDSRDWEDPVRAWLRLFVVVGRRNLQYLLSGPSGFDASAPALPKRSFLYAVW